MDQLERNDHPDAARRIGLALGGSALVGYGCLYYSFGAVLPSISADLEVSAAVASLAFTASGVMTALMAPGVGRLVDVVGAGRPMLIGSLLSVLVLIGASQARNFGQLVLAWACIGAVAAFVSYEPAFSYVVRQTAGEVRDRTLLRVVLLGGFASIVFVPVLGHLAATSGWRQALLFAAGVMFVVHVPVAVWLVRGESRARQASAALRGKQTAWGFLRTRTGLLLAGCLGTQGVIAGAVAAHLVTALLAEGLRAPVVYAAGACFGGSAVVGRVVVSLAGQALGLPLIMAAIYGAQALTLLLLSTGAHTDFVAVLAAVLLGVANGVGSLARPRMVLQAVHQSRFGSANGSLSAVVMLAKGLGPGLAGLALATGGYPAMWAGLGVLAIASVVVVGLGFHHK